MRWWRLRILVGLAFVPADCRSEALIRVGERVYIIICMDLPPFLSVPHPSVNPFSKTFFFGLLPNSACAKVFGAF
uniref:Putative secreted protein n=1 Tax=Anopheles marajoara TaxID=58244 RepID=A0A2M4CDP1_9DIPT